MPAEIEDFAERTEPATPRKRQEARERGQVARSADLSTALLLLGAFVLFLVIGEAMGNGVADFTRGILGAIAHLELTTESAAGFFTQVIATALSITAPFVLAMGAVAIAANYIQVGPVWAANVITPDLERLSPVRGFQRIASGRGLVRTAMGVGKLAVIGTVLFLILARYVRPGQGKSIFALFGDDIHTSFLRAKSSACELGITCALAMLILAILDYIFQRWHHERDLRMTRRELREEMKRFEGDPKIKERRRRMQRQIAFQKYLKEVPHADVVVTNPTEVAVALRYDPARDHAPLVVAKGEGLLAQRIREVALASGVPVLERPPVARALYRLVEVGREVPRELYEAVAEILAYVWRISGRHRERVA
jgi:flagellar biosynthesis protein FlhB